MRKILKYLPKKRNHDSDKKIKEPNKAVQFSTCFEFLQVPKDCMLNAYNYLLLTLVKPLSLHGILFAVLVWYYNLFDEVTVGIQP